VRTNYLRAKGMCTALRPSGCRLVPCSIAVHGVHTASSKGRFARSLVRRGRLNPTPAVPGRGPAWPLLEIRSRVYPALRCTGAPEVAGGINRKHGRDKGISRSWIPEGPGYTPWARRPRARLGPSLSNYPLPPYIPEPGLLEPRSSEAAGGG
jgi:hypothetical protein